MTAGNPLRLSMISWKTSLFSNLNDNLLNRIEYNADKSENNELTNNQEAEISRDNSPV